MALTKAGKKMLIRSIVLRRNAVKLAKKARKLILKKAIKRRR